MLPIQVSHLLDQAKLNAETPEERVYYLNGVIFTPKATIELIGIEGMASISDFSDPSQHSPLTKLVIRIQPGVYQNHVLPWKDRLEIEVNEVKGFNQTTRRYRCVPLVITDTNAESNSTHAINLEGLDVTNFISVEVQLIDLTFEIMKNIPVSDNFLIGNVFDVIHNTLTEAGENLPEDSGAKFKGVNIENPIDNDRIYDHIMVPTGTPLVHFVSWMQQRYGVYSFGAGSFFKDGFWYVFPLFNTLRYDNTSKSMDIIRIPKDTLPTAESSYYVNGDHITVLATGDVKFTSRADINAQNKGTGQQIISADAVNGTTGNHYNAGRSVVSRQDTMFEFRTQERGVGEINDKISINPVPTNNICRELSNSRIINGEVVEVTWENALVSKIIPGMPIKYFYMREDQVLVSRQGTLIGYNTYDVQNAVHGGRFQFRKIVKLNIFLGLTETEEN